MRDFPIHRQFEFNKRRWLVAAVSLLAVITWSSGPCLASSEPKIKSATGKESPELGREVAPGVYEAKLVFPPIQGSKTNSDPGLLFSTGQAGSAGVDPVSIAGAQEWTALMADDFESGFPGSWTLQYAGSGPYWDDWTCWSGTSATHSVGCAAGGTGAITCGQDYPGLMDSRMIYGPGSLADPDILDGVLECHLNLISEPEFDYFFLMVSIDGISYHGYMYSGIADQTISLDLTAVPTLGNILGESQVWLGFIFQSDESFGYANGAQIDDVLLAVDLAAGNQVPLITVTAPNGGETISAGDTQPITYTASDPDAGPSALALSFDYSTNSGGSWTTIATGQSNTGTYNWTVPDLSSATARVRVRATDGSDESSDTSNADFTILQNLLPVVAVTDPNGGESLAAGSTTPITYTASDGDAGPNPLSLSFDYSTNSGGTWTTIATGQSNAGFYIWTVPQLATTTGRVRVRATDGAGETSDISNADFSIIQNQNDLVLGDATGPSGTSVTIALALDNEDAVKGIQADIVFDGTKAFFSGISATARSSGMVVEGEQVAEDMARIILYYDTDNQLAAGSDDVAELTFTLQGTGGGSTPLTLSDLILSGPSGGALPVTGTNGQLTVQAPEEIPSLQITVLKNPGRTRTLQILVSVASGSGTAPTVAAGGSTIAMTSLGQAVYVGSYSATLAATSVTISASDTNIQGLGTAQATVSFP